MGIRGAAIPLALLAAFVAVGAVRDLASYTSSGSSLDFNVRPAALDFGVHGDVEVKYIRGGEVNPWRGKKVVKFYDPVKHSVKKKKKCGEGEVLVTGDYGKLKCVNKEKEVPVEVVKEEPECLEGETLEEGPDGELVCVFTCPEGEKAETGPDGPICVLDCPEGEKAEEGPDGTLICVVDCPENTTAEVGPDGVPVCVFSCPEGFKQVGDTEECEEDVPEVESVTVPAEPPVVETPVVEAVVVPEEEAPAPVPAPVVPEEPVPEEPVAEEPTPEPTPEEPTPVEPTPVEPAPVEPAPVEPAPVEPAPVEPVPVEPTPEVEVQTVPEPEEAGTCPPGQFFMEKVEARGCQECDANCAEGSCTDLVGCGLCKPGYFTQREDIGWPFECVLCESAIPGCSKCKDNITLEIGETPQCEA